MRHTWTSNLFSRVFTCSHLLSVSLSPPFFFFFYSLRCYSKIHTSFNNSCQNIQKVRDYRNRSLKNEHLFVHLKKKKKARQRTNEYSGCRKRTIKCDGQMKTNSSTFPFRLGIALSKLISHDRTITCENGQEWNETIPPTFTIVLGALPERPNVCWPSTTLGTGDSF